MTLFEALLDLARRLTMVREGTATAVAATSITDSSKQFANGELIEGTLYLIETTPRAVRITGNAGDKINFASLSPAPGAGVSYAVASPDYPLDVLIQSINAAVRDLYAVPLRDSTLTTDSTKSEYDLPSGVFDLLRVEIETPANYSVWGPAPTYYAESHYWHELNGKLIFLPGCEPRTDDLTIRLTYRDRPAAISSMTAVIPEGIDPELLLWKATAHALRWGLQKYGQDPDRRIVDRLNEAQQEIARRGGNKRNWQPAVKLGAW